MAKITREEIQVAIDLALAEDQARVEALKSANPTKRYYYCGLKSNPEDLISNLSKKESNGLSFSHEESFGGEGQGDTVYEVAKVTKSDGSQCYIQFVGYYDSNNGSDYDGDFDIVEPYIEPVRKWKGV